MRSLCEELKRFAGHPVEIFTDDGRVTRGIDLGANMESCRVIDRCGRVVFIENRHIDSIVEPQMELQRCCEEREHRCHEERD